MIRLVNGVSIYWIFGNFLFGNPNCPNRTPYQMLDKQCLGNINSGGVNSQKVHGPWETETKITVERLKACVHVHVYVYV